MGSRKEGIVTSLLVSSIVITSLTVVVLGYEEDYPWFHYFQKPEAQWLHFAFGDSEGNIIVASGDFHNSRPEPPRQVYRFKGMYSIVGSHIEEIACPDWIYVVDGVIDRAGRVCLLIGTWREDERDPYPGIQAEWVSAIVPANVGYRAHYYPSGWWGHLEDYRLAFLEGSALIEFPNLMDGILGEPLAMSIDCEDRIFLISADTTEFPPLGDEFISWWYVDDPLSRRTLYISEILPNGVGQDYPQFGRDGLVYLLIGYSLEAFRDKCAVLCLNPDTEECDVYDGEDSPFLDCAIEYFRIDDNNVKWFGTEDGLVAFDGENWIRLTTDNSGLPYNLVRQIEYDDVDQVYYVISQTGSSGEYYSAFSILHPGGRSLGASLHFPVTSYPWDLPRIYRDARETLWLVHPYGYELYSYDHERVLHWDTADWMEDPWAVGYIGCDSQGRTFLITRTCVMIW